MTVIGPYAQTILNYLADCDAPVAAREVSTATGESADSVRTALKQLQRAGLVRRQRAEHAYRCRVRAWLWTTLEPRVPDAPVPLHVRAVRSLPALAGVVAEWARSA